MDRVHLIYFRCLHWDEMSPVFSSAARNISEDSVTDIFTTDTLVLCSALNKNIKGYLIKCPFHHASSVYPADLPASMLNAPQALQI